MIMIRGLISSVSTENKGEERISENVVDNLGLTATDGLLQGSDSMRESQPPAGSTILYSGHPWTMLSQPEPDSRFPRPHGSGDAHRLAKSLGVGAPNRNVLL